MGTLLSFILLILFYTVQTHFKVLTQILPATIDMRHFKWLYMAYKNNKQSVRVSWKFIFEHFTKIYFILKSIQSYISPPQTFNVTFMCNCNISMCIKINKEFFLRISRNNRHFPNLFSEHKIGQMAFMSCLDFMLFLVHEANLGSV